MKRLEEHYVIKYIENGSSVIPNLMNFCFQSSNVDKNPLWQHTASSSYSNTSEHFEHFLCSLHSGLSSPSLPPSSSSSSSLFLKPKPSQEFHCSKTKHQPQTPPKARRRAFPESFQPLNLIIRLNLKKKKKKAPMNHPLSPYKQLGSVITLHLASAVFRYQTSGAGGGFVI